MSGTTDTEKKLNRVLAHDGVQAVALVRATSEGSTTTIRMMDNEPAGREALIRDTLDLVLEHKSLLATQSGFKLRLVAGDIAFQVEEGPGGLALVGFIPGHPVVKSLRRMTRSLVGASRAKRGVPAPQSHTEPTTASAPPEGEHVGA